MEKCSVKYQFEYEMQHLKCKFLPKSFGVTKTMTNSYLEPEFSFLLGEVGVSLLAAIVILI